MSRLNETHCRTLAAQLGHIVSSVLWPRYEARIRARAGRIKLSTRVGSGNATYHRADRRGGHLIVFGWKMVQQKSAGWSTASRWTSGREMIARGYFDGHIDLVSVLAHAACHEFAHLVQTVEGGRTRGSVHNAAFYLVLDEMHHTGVAQEVLAVLAEQCRSAGIDARWKKGAESGLLVDIPGASNSGRRRGRTSRSLQPPIAGRRPALARAMAMAAAAFASVDRDARSGSSADLRPGDPVCFVARGQRITGRVRRVNRRTVSIVPDRPSSPGQYWRVAPGLLDRI